MRFYAPCGFLWVLFFNRQYINLGPIAQLGERCVRNAEVRGSIPLGSTIMRRCEYLFIVRNVFSVTIKIENR